MKQIRIHGRGGQGSLVLAQFLAIGALEDQKYGQAFPFLGAGGERKGKPIVAFCRISDKPIRTRARIAEPDYAIVQDVTILAEVDVAQGIQDDGIVLVNTEQEAGQLGLRGKFRTVSFAADNIARSIMGHSMANSAMLGAFAAITQELSLDAALSAVRRRLPGPLGEKNALVVLESYRQFAQLSRGG